MFLCARCRIQVLLCSGCDRGQIYCGRSCAAQARGQAQREAGRRYQSSRPGRFAHAARAKRYRARCKIVTHQGSVGPARGDVLASVAALPQPEVITDSVLGVAPAQHCARCGARGADALRMGFLRHRRLVLDRPIGANRTEGIDDHPP
jgi:hypothetical protein